MKGFHVVFLSHAASRSGAPIVLLNFIKWLKQNSDFTFSIVLKYGGELSSEFEKLGRTYVWNEPVGERRLSINKIYSKLSNVINPSDLSRNKLSILNSLKEQKPDLIYANTIDTVDVAGLFKESLGCPVVCHVHELQAAIDMIVGKAKFTESAKNINHFIAASEAVKDNLVKNSQVDSEKIDVIFEFIDTSARTRNTAIEKGILEEFNIPKNSFIVGGSGTIEWRKGVDLFLQTALFLKTVYNIPAYFIWIGGNKNSQAFYELNYDIEKLGLQGSVIFTGMKSNPLDFAAILDAFVMTSREDPYPLVCLEAAMLEKPVICFAESGGMPEFVSDDCGFVVPYLRPDLMAEKLSYLFSNRSSSNKLGANGREKVLKYHNVDYASKGILKIIDKVKSVHG